MAIKCVILDVGGVLVSDRIEPVFDNLNKKVGKRVFERETRLHKNVLTGKRGEKKWFKELSKKSGLPEGKLRKMLVSEYTRKIKINKSMIKAVKRLKKYGYKTGIISNISPAIKEVNYKRKLFDIFEPVVLSCDVGCAKPHKKIFDVFLKKAKLKPHECIFIDDREEHLHYPNKIGIKIIHFKNSLQLANDLKRYGVKI